MMSHLVKDDSHYARKIRELPQGESLRVAALVHEALHLAGWPLTAHAVLDAFFSSQRDFAATKAKLENKP